MEQFTSDDMEWENESDSLQFIKKSIFPHFWDEEIVAQIRLDFFRESGILRFGHDFSAFYRNAGATISETVYFSGKTLKKFHFSVIDRLRFRCLHFKVWSSHLHLFIVIPASEARVTFPKNLLILSNVKKVSRNLKNELIIINNILKLFGSIATKIEFLKFECLLKSYIKHRHKCIKQAILSLRHCGFNIIGV
jgi:hypothetical protein